MKLALAADHAGFALKEQLRERLARQGHQVEDLGAFSAESVDYPDFALAAGRKVAAGEADFGILVCFTGVGMSIAANKIPGIRAALGTTPDEVSLVRAHNNANILTLGARYTDVATAGELVDVFLKTPFEGGRHQRRVDKIHQIEQGEATPR